MTQDYNIKAKELAIDLANATAPVANYIPFVVSGKIVFISGQIAVEKGQIKYKGKVGKDLSLEDGKKAAELCAKNIIAHKHWMWRSYAMALTAVTFRVYYLILYLYDVPLTLNYEVSLWMSVVGNLIVAEILIYKNNKTKKHLRTAFNQLFNFKKLSS
jgi:hypothetical protein